MRDDSSTRLSVFAYRHALELKPNYVRAWVNMGISYANQNKHLTAAKYYAKALRYDIAARVSIYGNLTFLLCRQNDTAEHIWSYLRIACTALGREELVTACDARDIRAFQDLC